jgi:hypothetical protein
MKLLMTTRGAANYLHVDGATIQRYIRAGTPRSPALWVEGAQFGLRVYRLNWPLLFTTISGTPR